jgi:hypothetical protein
MFVVEPGSGKNRGYATAEELGAAIRRGELGPKARIYHRATDRWLPITVHPEYRRVAAEREQMSARQLQGRQWTFLPGSGDTATAPRAPLPDAAAKPGPAARERWPSWLGSTVRRLRGLTHL